ncbi:MAG: GspH/FimT family pseudopilin [Gammaproteobacteria bacterium]|nr:GspH/FimT family pseudopilin [Gammaproteobacteria bacterium]
MKTYSLIKGFSLMELMVTIAIVAIVTTTALPSFQSMFDTYHVRSQTNNFISALKLARTEAMRRGENIKVCNSNSNQSDCGSSGDWQYGWVARNSSVLKSWKKDDTSTMINADADSIEYTKYGRITASTNLNFEFTRNSCIRKVSVKRTGRAAADQSGC